MNAIKWTIKALRQLRKINQQDNKRIRNAVDELENMPNCRNVKSLTNHKYSYRIKVGDYRVFFEFDGAIHIVEIQEVKKRNERTYN